mmetsp:Transcript_16745/g.31856  ORF Transcript_16745/g.31856 Transcript_16745/m.31856 type:complete len:330 (+) Transcript_16745:115-1104(+)
MSLDLYPSIIHEGDLSPDAFGDEVDAICQEIQKATKGFGTDEKRLLKAMGSMSAETRCKVPIRFKEMFDKDLRALVKSECGNRDFGTALKFLAVDPVSAECDMINKACKGLGTNETLLYPIICGRSNKEMEILKKKYFEIHTKDLGRVLDSELGGNFESLIFNALQAAEEAYDPEYHNDEKMEEDAAKLYEMGQGKWGTDEKGLFKIFCASPPEYLKKLNLVYADKYGFTLIKAMETEVGGDAGRAGLYMLGMKIKPYETVAKLIDTACKGFGTNELLLTTTLIRYQKILGEVKVAYEEMKGKTLEEEIESETRGDYERILLEIVAAAE